MRFREAGVEKTSLLLVPAWGSFYRLETIFYVFSVSSIESPVIFAIRLVAIPEIAKGRRRFSQFNQFFNLYAFSVFQKYKISAGR